MKILLLGFGKIAYMPYMHLYLDTIQDAEFELIYWDRDGKTDASLPSKIRKAYRFEAYLEENLPFKKKLAYFWRYRQFALKVLKKNTYDRIIVLHTTPGLTLIDYLGIHYKGKYLLDFRDISYEYIPIYRKLVERLSNNAALTVVSSNAFRNYLNTSQKVYTVHNYLEDALAHTGVRNTFSRDREVIRISFWGLVRQVAVNKQVMDALGNDMRFELHYYGRMQQDARDMEVYAKENNYQNVFFHGTYMPEERYGFAQNTDLLHNVYDLGHTTGNAMGNKFYDGILFEIPQICTEGSHMGKYVTEAGVGITVQLDDPNFADSLYAYYHGMNWQAFSDNCREEMARIIAEQNETKKVILAFCGA